MASSASSVGTLWENIEELRTDEDVWAVMQQLSGPAVLSVDFFNNLCAGRPIDDGGQGAALLMKLLLRYRLPSEKFVNYRGMKAPKWFAPIWPQYKTTRAIPLIKLKAPVVSDEFLQKVIQRMQEVELTNKSLEEVDMEAEIVHWMSAVSHTPVHYM
ncbi:hypothetical protein HDU87_000909 [Geranomyces variabilis]|uniref:Uncharacterized protein n=1 Tax=Geranomyces variabilis TaxID=109894 RepID=A0AAD5XIF3_9FUNG|nr:hypothetical protein HDU87_000909 [Geranomyces variabilis]